MKNFMTVLPCRISSAHRIGELADALDVIVTWSPALIGPMPDGVPVEMMSPGSSVITDVMNATRKSIVKISSRGRRVLAQLAVDPALDPDPGHGVAVEADGDARADRREGVEALGAGVLRRPSSAGRAR